MPIKLKNVKVPDYRDKPVDADLSGQSEKRKAIKEAKAILEKAGVVFSETVDAQYVGFIKDENKVPPGFLEVFHAYNFTVTWIMKV